MELDTLKRKRSSIKMQLTLFKKYLDGIDDNIDSTIIKNIEERLTKIEPLFDQFHNVQSEIDILENLAEGEISTEYELVQNTYFDLIARAKSICNKDEELYELASNHSNMSVVSHRTEPIRLQNSSNNIRASVVTDQNTPRHMDISNVKLPRITLPTFDGSFTKWREFYDNFKALVDSNNTISKSEKLCYLKASVKDEAANLLASFETIDANYDIAFDLLKERYNNIRRIIHTHVRALLDLENITKESHISLRNLIDNSEKHMRCLKTLNQPTHEWDALIVPILSIKLDNATNREWETKVNSENNSKNNVPTYKEFIAFLNQRQCALEAIALKKSVVDTSKGVNSNKRVTAFMSSTQKSCLHCNKEDHMIYKCESFLKLNTDSRINRVKEIKACINCLRKGHFAIQCQSRGCKMCNKKHNSLLHLNKRETVTESKIDQENAAPAKEETGVVGVSYQTQTQTLLSTAILQFTSSTGELHTGRALLDSGSQSCFMTDEFARKLELPRTPLKFCISGVGKNEVNLNSQVYAEAQSAISRYKFDTSYLVIPCITEKLPLATFNKNELKIPQHFKLADPNFNKRDKIDILIGASVFWEVLKGNQMKLGTSGPILQDTKLGWIVCGNIPRNSSVNKTITGLSLDKLDDQLQRFWKVEEFTNTKLLTQEERFCEQHFDETFTRNAEGRFIVRMPLKENKSELGDSQNTAIQRFESLERKLHKNDKLKKAYTSFMQEYHFLNHMTRIEFKTNEVSVYLPHHGVIKESSSTTKLRVVFDASCKTTSGLSLNDVQCVGPTLQSDMFTILINFRLSPYVAIGDIEKMYRQILIHPDDRRYQTIIWRTDVNNPIETFELNTVTYGTASAPYLATKCLIQLAEQNQLEYPVESNIIMKNFYVDDLLMGADTIEELTKRRDNIVKILKTARFNLRKWNSNVQELSDTDNSVNTLNNILIKTLGILWDSKKDTLLYNWNAIQTSEPTKRTILGATAQLFDPMGLLSPITIVPKLIIQDLWHEGLEWDEPVSKTHQEKWSEFKDTIHCIDNINIPRYCIKSSTHVQLMGFADASERAYGACVYIKTTTSVNLLAAKSRVAPLRTTTLPRLELCAAVLLARLISKVKESLSINITGQYHWSDSKIVLCWINSEPAKWSTYVGNRVAVIQGLTDPETWQHVRSEENPADLISRGATANQLKDNQLWWMGPDWLSEDFIRTRSKEIKYPNEVPEKRSCTNKVTTEEYDMSIFQRYSNLNKLINVASYCYRFSTKLKGPLTVEERQKTLEKLIKIVQTYHFRNEIKEIKKSNLVSTKSKLLPLSPFLDNKTGLLRVGGRIKNANIDYNNQHQILLPASDNLTKLIAQHEHEVGLHCGPQTLLNNLRQKYWPLNGKNLVKHIFRGCVKCFRANPKGSKFVMGDLPDTRVNPAPPFSICGIDYAGPFIVKERKMRNPKTYKSYVAIFVCFVTKAIHIELVSDLTTECFLGALRRFISRRGKPTIIYSDNATNFTGANRELHDIIQSSNVANELAKDFIKWRFIPPRSPHMGGLWEAGVRSVKTHMRRVIGNTTLTIEQFHTLLIQIEAILNSRPISSISDNPNDLNPLTPGHFLIGRPLTTIFQPIIPEKVSNMSLFLHVQTMVDHFWQRWQREYLHQLQMRYKWYKGVDPKKGDLVLIMEDNLPPLAWKLGRIADLHPGSDGIVRVVTIKTSTNLMKRALAKVCFLPSDIESAVPFQGGRDV